MAILDDYVLADNPLPGPMIFDLTDAKLYQVDNPSAFATPKPPFAMLCGPRVFAFPRSIPCAQRFDACCS